MIIYKGWYHFKREKGFITKVDMGKHHHGTLIGCHSPEEWDIWVNENDSLEEQVKTVLEELAHLGLEHDTITKESLDEKYKAQREEAEGTSPIKKIIDAEVEKFYLRNPPLLQKIREMLAPEEIKQEDALKIADYPGQLSLFD